MILTKDKAQSELFNTSDTILICDTFGKVLFYQDFNDKINMIRGEDAIGRNISELYPFLKRNDFTTFRAMDKKQIENIREQIQNIERREIDGAEERGQLRSTLAGEAEAVLYRYHRRHGLLGNAPGIVPRSTIRRR